MIKYFIYLFIFAASNLFAIQVGTFNAPPFSMYEDGENIGMATEAVRKLLKECGIDKYNIINYPLARGLAELEDQHIDIYYPYIIENTEETTNYILVGPIARYKIALFVRKDYAHQISLPAMKGLIVGAERGSVSNRLLQEHNIHIEQATQSVSCLRMVIAERVSACAIGSLPGQYSAAINNLNGKLRHAETGAYADMYVVLGKSLPNELIERIKSTFEQLKEKEYFAKQQIEYEEKFAVFIKTLS